jgi:hypothetical protein
MSNTNTINKNRRYKLTIGDYSKNEAFELETHQVTFDINKTSDNKTSSNSASIEITNLDSEIENLINTDYVYVRLDVGYEDDVDLKTVYVGQAVSVITKKAGADIVTQVVCGTGYTELNHSSLSKVIPENTTVKEAFELITKEIPNVSRGVFNGVNINSKITKGYTTNGTVKEILDKLSDTYNLEWRLNDNVLFINDVGKGSTDRYETAYVVNERTGLIGEPYKTSGDGRKGVEDETKTKGIQFSMLLNPNVTAGDVVKVESDRIEGWFKVDDIRYYGGYRSNEWYGDVACSYIEKVVNKT